MKSLKKCLAFLVIFTMIVSTMGVAVLATTDPTVSIGTAEGLAGDTVTVDVNLANNPGFVNLTLKVAYDEDLELTSIADKGVLGSCKTYTASYSNPHTLKWSNATAESDFTVNGAVATLTFKIKDTATKGPKNITFNEVTATNYNFGSVTFTPVAGSVTVSLPKYNVIFVDGADEIGRIENVEKGSKISAEQLATIATTKESTVSTDYAFSKWTAADGSDVTVTDVVINGATTFKAVYVETVRTYDVTVKAKDGDVTETVNYGTKLGDNANLKTALENVEEWVGTGDFEGAPFTGWEDGVTVDTVVTGAMTIKPMFGGDLMTINFYDGEEIKSTKKTLVAKGEKTIADPTGLTKTPETHYTFEFAGWAESADAEEVEYAKEDVTINTDDYEKDAVLNLYAIYTKVPNKYTVTVEGSDATIKGETGVITFAGTVTVPYMTYYADAINDFFKTVDTDDQTAEIQAYVVDAKYNVTYAKKTGDTTYEAAKALDIVEGDVTIKIDFEKKPSGGSVQTGTVIRPGNGGGAGGAGGTTKPDDNKEDTTTPDDNKEDTTTPDDNKEDTTTPDDTTTPGTSAPVVIEGVEDFADLAGYDWAAPHIDVLVKAGLISGNGTNNYLPDSKFNRGQAAKLLLKLVDAPEAASDAADVPADAWFAPFIGGAKAAGIMGGDPDGSMRPLDDITRQEMAKMIFSAIGEDAIKALVSEEAAATFADASDIADWAAEPFKYLAALGIITGYEDGSVKPTANITNAEAAVMVSRAMAILELLNVEEAPAEDTTEETVEETEEDAVVEEETAEEVVEEEATEEEITEE